MLSENADLLDQMTMAINKKWQTRTQDVPDYIGLRKKYANLIDKSYVSQSKTADSIQAHERRLECLERQNDQLLSFINFLLENLPELVLSILHPDHSSNEKTDCYDDLKQAETSELPNVHKNNEPFPTRREKDVLDLLVKGLCAKEIANRLFISETTVITHKKHLKEKFCARNTVELISKAQAYIIK